MSNLHVKYLLVGGGVASYSAARAIRERDPEGTVLLVGQEINRPYHRPPLSKAFLRREVPRESLFAAEPGWFDRHHVELRTGRRVSHLDVGRRSAVLDSGEEIAFDKLLLATGATPAALDVPGAHLPNLFTLRTFDDEAILHNAIEKAKHEGRPHVRGRGRAVVIGGGRLGVELAGTLTQLGLAVDLVVSRSHPWHRFAGEGTGKLITRFLEGRGVTVHLNAHPQRLEGDGRVQRVVLEPGRVIPCDFAISAVGSMPNKEILRGTPLAAEKAILVDEYCRTNVPDVYAAGDCCAVRDPLFGKYRWIDHSDNAVVTGTLAGHNMAGANEGYAALGYFWTEVFGLMVKVWGEKRLVDRRLLRGTPNVEAPDLVEVGVAADGRVAQVVAVGHTGEDELLRELVARRLAIDGNEESLKDPAVPLTNLLR